MIQVLIADDHAIVREGLKRILESRADIVVEAEAEGREQVLSHMRACKLDVIVLDLTLGRDSGLEILKQIHAEHPALPVLILSMHSEEQFAARMLKAGAAGYLTKESAPSQLVSAIIKVAGGGRYVSEAMAERLAFELATPAGEEPHERLSDREYQIFHMITTGRGLTEIANDLNLSVKTVSTHRSRILMKMGLKNNAELIHYAIRQGLIGG